MAGGDPVIEVRGLRVRFGEHVVLHDLDLAIERREVFALVGGSGVGKTTLLHQLILLDTPSAGSIRLFGEEVVGLGDRAADRLRRRAGVMFQQGALFSSLTVLENVALPLREHTDLDDATIHDLASLKVALVGLPCEAGALHPSELSGGMRKRVAVARALALDPELLFLDEPSAGLDPVSAGEMDDLILRLRDSLGLTVVLVTHDLDTLCRIVDRVAFLDGGRIVGLGTVAALRDDPHPALRAYFRGPRGRAALGWT
ncbi:MAG: ATP-binding cassette domain-containing protein [Gammaproteobacteria bacterium]|nr:ATP-binding cassette domain-containing protein [Gammaproteobacteria bacterium]